MVLISEKKIRRLIFITLSPSVDADVISSNNKLLWVWIL